VLIRKIHQLRRAFSKIPIAIYSLCSWWVFGSSTLQLVDFSNRQFAVGEFSLGGVEIGQRKEIGKKEVVRPVQIYLFINCSQKSKHHFFQKPANFEKMTTER